MNALPTLERYQLSIRHQCWMVRHYARGARVTMLRRQREEAIRALGLLLREAFNSTEDFEPLLTAVVDGLRPRYEEQPF